MHNGGVLSSDADGSRVALRKHHQSRHCVTLAASTGSDKLAAVVQINNLPFLFKILAESNRETE